MRAVTEIPNILARKIHSGVGRLKEVVGYWEIVVKGEEFLESQYRWMHENQKFCGSEWTLHVENLRRLIPDLTNYRILDYGCGPNGGLRKMLGSQVVAHDPYLTEYANYPWEQECDILFSTDVLEHLLQSQLLEFYQRVLQNKPAFIYLNISTRRAHLKLPNGANAHLTVRDSSWWLDEIKSHWGENYEVVMQDTCSNRKELIVFLKLVGN